MKFLKNQVKMKLKKGQTAVGSWINLPSLEVVEIMAQENFDFLVIDLEHSAITTETMQNMIRVIEGYGVAPFVRVVENHPVPIKKALDAGAYGIIVPMVCTAEEAKSAVSSVYYPPLGNRGVGLSRAQGFGLAFDEYKEWYSTNVVLIVQIEHKAAIENLSDILGVKHIDGTMIGPYDLSGSLGYPGEYERKDVLAALKIYESVSKKVKVPTGAHIVQPSLGTLKDKKKKGYQFIAYGLDEIFLKNQVKDICSSLFKKG